MKNYLYTYIYDIEDALKKKDESKLSFLKEDILIKIPYFQHERLIHLLVTFFYAFIFLVFLIYNI